jgi:hypothetical protein
MISVHASAAKNAVSIITCTKRPDCMHRLFHNYSRQNYKNKELIVILNNKNMRINDYINAAKKYKNVRIYRMPSHVSLGRCLNFGVGLCKHSFIAKFDDDDYYSPHYLSNSMRAMKRKNADIVGKRAHYMYLNGKKLLLLRHISKEKKYVSRVQGATLLVKRHVFNRVAFANRSLGECVKFCSDSRAKGYKIYSGNKYNFIAFRRRNSKNHTWIVSDKYLLTRKVKVLKVKNIRRFVSRK